MVLSEAAASFETAALKCAGISAKSDPHHGNAKAGASRRKRYLNAIL